MSLHVPRTGPGGIFEGESGESDAAQTLVVLDDGVPTALPSLPAIDHDGRVIRSLDATETSPPDLDPPAIALEHTAARRRLRAPTTTSTSPDGQDTTVTQWIFYSGAETQVQQRDGGQDRLRHFDQVQHYDGRKSEEVRRVDTRDVTVYDFHWRTNFGNDDAPAWRVGTRYRTLTINRWGTDPKDFFYLHTRYIQALYQNVRLEGEIASGWQNVLNRYTVEVTRVRSREYAYDGDGRPLGVLATWVDAWYNVVELEAQSSARRPESAVAVLFRERPYYYVTRKVGDEGDVLRDTLRPEWPASPEPAPERFVAAGGQVRVEGPRTTRPQLLEDSTGKPNALLTAFGHRFTGGTWAALRDVPLRRDDGTLDWDRVLVLHASVTTVTAVRQDGSAATLSLEAFEREVLRTDPGTFGGFSPIGTLFNTWPAHWAWARCAGETRAVVVHEAWRDSYKRDAPEGSPAHWTWKERPGKRPVSLPASAPLAPLGLTLADVAGTLLHDEPLARGAGPLLLPATATAGGQDVRRAVAKRLLYLPAQWPEELDDKTSTAGPLTLTYALPAVKKGDVRGAALLLRLKLAPGATTITVNGEVLPLARLGHNADAARGWQPYVVPVPAASLYTLTFRGRCSRALLCVHSWTPPQEGGDAT